MKSLTMHLMQVRGCDELTVLYPLYMDADVPLDNLALQYRVSKDITAVLTDKYDDGDTPYCNLLFNVCGQLTDSIVLAELDPNLLVGILLHMQDDTIVLIMEKPK